MKTRALLVGILVLWAVVTGAASIAPVRGTAVVATDHVAASEAGRAVLSRGGNAVDAAVAAALAAGVVQPGASGLGGGGFAVISEGTRHRSLDFREVAPAAAHRQSFEQLAPGASRAGVHAVAVPGESRGLARLVREEGRLSLRVVAGPAIDLATKGFVVGDHLARTLRSTPFVEVRSLYTYAEADGGGCMTNPALAATLRRWVASGGEDLYTGRGAQRIVDRIRRDEGWIQPSDLSAYEPKERQPLVGRFGSYTIVTMAPPSSGGVALLQALSVLDGFDLTSMGHNSSDALHLIAEALKHVFADRAHHLGDPDFVDVPVERLLSPDRAMEIQRKIWPSRTFEPIWYGPPIAPPTDGGTQHISVIDAQGMAVALTTTINTMFGSGVVPDGLGILLNNEMDDFATAPGVPNAFGLLGAEANAVAPGKRPLSSMTPTIILDEDGRVLASIGASGGSTIISSTLQVFLNLFVFGLDPQAAVSAPRIHHQWQPDVLVLEPELPKDVVRALEARGHTVRIAKAYSAVQAVQRRDGMVFGASDPRKGGAPAAIPLVLRSRSGSAPARCDP